MKSIFRHLRLGRSMILLPTPLEHGENLTRLDLSESVKAKVKDFITWKMLKKYLVLQPNQFLNQLYVMQEFLQTIKKKILIDKLNFFIKRFQKRKSFLTSVLALILKEKVFKPFWNESTLTLSKQLSLPIKTDCVDLALNSSNGFLKKPIQNSWFSIQLQQIKGSLPTSSLIESSTNESSTNESSLKTSCPLLTSLSQETTALDQPSLENKEKNFKKRKRKQKALKKNKKDDELSAIKLKIFPTKEQQKILKVWMGASRFIYNKILSFLKEQYKTTKKNNFNLKFLRSKFINNDNYQIENKWLLDIPYDIRDEALRDLLKNYKSNFEKMKISKKAFELKYKSKKDLESINVLSKHWNFKKGLYSEILTQSMSCEKPLPYKLDYTSRILKTQLNEYYICIPHKTPKNRNNGCENQTKRIISIDPGVRTFMTCYDPEGYTIKYGSQAKTQLYRLLTNKRKLQSSISKLNGSKKRRYQTAYKRLSKKIENLVQELHRKISLWLCSNYNTILIPKLNVHNFKNMSKRNKNQMSVLNHCLFVDRLISKSREFKDCIVTVVTEEFTSKTCGCCGLLNHKLGSSETFKCDGCLVEIDRDINGARNILLKYKTEHY